MIGKMFFFVVFSFFSVAFVQGDNYESYSDFDVLKNITDEAGKKVVQSFAQINKSPEVYYDFIEDRFGSLMWECVAQARTLNKSITDAVFKGMLRNKKFTNFQCISDNGQNTHNKIAAFQSQIPVTSKTILEKGLEKVMPLRLILGGLYDYIQDLYKNENEKMKKAESEGARKKILDEVMKKLKLLTTILGQVDNQVYTSKFKFFEEYINYASTMDNNLRNTQKQGTQNVLKCVA